MTTDSKQKSCSHCGLRNHPFRLTFSKVGLDYVCSACISHDEFSKQGLDWEERAQAFSKILKKSKAQSKTYDVLVPVRGDAEDFYVIPKLINIGLNPLVVLVNNYFMNDIGWTNTHRMVTEFDVDFMVYNPEIGKYKEAIKTSLRKYGSLYWPYKALATAYVMSLAAEKSIPLVIWGMCQPLEFAGKYSHQDNLAMTKWWWIEHELNGVNPKEFLGSGAQISDQFLELYGYPERKKIKGTHGLFLSNYFPWDQSEQNQKALQYGFTPQRQKNTFDYFENAGSSVYYELHDLLRVQKFGQPKLSDHLARELRFGRIPGQVVRKLQTELTNYVSYNIQSFFLEFLDVTKSGYEWFKKNRLHAVSDLIDQDADDITDSIQKYQTEPLSCKSKIERDRFVKFKKGI